tara:strand:+ start:7781 stop:8035 length:255 start_codon:yes stop_codon:yes gene_type:complete
MKDLFSLTEAEFEELDDKQIHRYLIEQGGYTEKELKAWVNKTIKLIRVKEKRPMLPALFASLKNPDIWGVVVLVAIVAALLFGG